MQSLVAVTGASGGLGSRVARGLAARGMPVRIVVRDPARAPSVDGAEVAIASGYGDRAAMTAAFRGADALFLVSGRESATRAAEHVSAVDAAVDAGVRRIVYTSFLGAAPDATFTFARQHHATEEHVRGTGLAWTFLRNSMYMEMVPRFASADGVIAGPGGDGRTAWVARDDVADVAVAVLAERGHDGQAYEVTGPESHTLAYAAAVLGRVAGRPVVYREETIEEAYASRAGYGAPAFEVEGWVTSYVQVARDELDVVTDVVPRLTGHAAQTLPEFLAANPDSWAHLRPAPEAP